MCWIKRLDSALLGRSGAPSVDDDERYLAEVGYQVRTDFPETWLWDERVVG